MTSKHPFAVAFSLAALALSACVAGPEETSDLLEEESEIEEAGDALTNSPSTTAERWIVNLTFPNVPSPRRCTASVLTNHWLLTAAHCVDGLARGVAVSVTVATAGATGDLYTGNARPYAHEHYQPSSTSPDVSDDIAIVKLDGVSGIDTGYTGKAKLWGYTTPWTSSSTASRTFSIIGYGLSDAACDGDDSTKRLASGFVMDKEGFGATRVKSPFGSTHTCGGDSGAPYLLTSSGVRRAVAVHSGRYFDVGSLSTKQQGALIPPKRAWMFDTSRAYTSLQLSCGTECTESAYNPEPPPGPACPSGQHCCEPFGNVCNLCLPNNVQCP